MSLPSLQKLPNIVDFHALQADLLHGLLATPALHQVNIIEEHKFLLDSTVQVDAIWQTPRNGGQGAGIIVEMVQATVQSPNLPGPVFDLEVGFVCVEERNLNFTPAAGTFLTAEQLAQICLDVWHRHFIEGIGTFQATGIAPARDWFDDSTSIHAVRAKLKLANPRTQTPRVAIPDLTWNTDSKQMSVTCLTPGAEIWFTVDGSFPAPTGNATAHQYSSAVPLESGQTFRAAAFADGYNLSPVRTYTAS